MMVKWTRLSILLMVLIVAVVALAYVTGYFSLVAPVKSELELSEEQLRIQQQVLEKNIGDQGDNTVGLTTELQRKLPVEKATDDLLVLLDQVERASNSQINQIAINESGVSDRFTAMHESIAMLEYQLQVSSPSYNQMYRFLEELRDGDRILNINQLQFGREATDRLEFNLTFGAYYSPSLFDLKVEAPE